MARYTVKIWQLHGEEFSFIGNLRVNAAGIGRWSMDAPYMSRCLGGRWIGGHSDAPQGSIYLDNQQQQRYMMLNAFIPFPFNNYPVGTTGDGAFIDPPFHVNGNALTWRVDEVLPD